MAASEELSEKSLDAHQESEARVCTKIRDLKVGTACMIRGWIKKARLQKKNYFLEISDGLSSLDSVQIVSKPTADPITLESYVEIEGDVKAVPGHHKTNSGLEIHARKIIVIGPSDSEYPGMCPVDASPFLRLAKRHLYLRHDHMGLITRIQTRLVDATRKYFNDCEMLEIFPPFFVGNQCEGGSTLFKVPYPNGDGTEIQAYLTQSSQFYLEMTLAALRTETFCIAPSFRAEPHCHTRRHLTEFLHAECEWKDIFTFEDHIKKLKDMLSGILKNFLQMAEQDLIELGKLTNVDLLARAHQLVAMTEDIMILSHSEAITYCREHSIYKDPENMIHFDAEDDIPEAQERQMIDQIGKIVFLTKFPHAFKSFYFARCDEDPNLVQGIDVEVPGVGEIIGSGVREYDYEKLLANIHAAGLKPEEYTELLDLRKYGHARTSGMGLGIGRMLTWILGMDSIRDVTTFPRYAGRLTP